MAIITAAARGAMTGMHARVPVTIAPDDFELWLDCRGENPSDAIRLLHAPADGAFAWHPVSSRVNRVANDDAQLVLPMTADEIAAAAAIEAPAKAARPRRSASAAPGNDGQGSLF